MGQRIVHITYSLKGGAGNALKRHSEFLIQKGISSTIVLGDGKTKETKNIFQLENLVRINFLDRVFRKIGNLLYKYMGDNPFSGRLVYKLFETELIKNADIIELRMLHSGGGQPYFNLGALKRIKNKKIIWRLSDMWAFTGFCPYDLGCGKFKSSCGPCPQLTTDKEKAELPKPKWDFSRYQQRRKKNIYKKLDITFIAPSHWIKENAESSIIKKQRLVEIPIGLDLDVFKPLEKNNCRDYFKVPRDKFIIACNIPNLENYRKAFDLLEQSLKGLDKTKDVVLLIIGNKPRLDLDKRLGLKVFSTGFLKKDEDLVKAYNCANIFVFPSRMDNSAQVLLESSACGLPVVAFDVGGNSQYINRSQTGILVEAYDINLFKGAIEKLADDYESIDNMSILTRKNAMINFAIEFQFNNFLEIYNS